MVKSLATWAHVASSSRLFLRCGAGVCFEGLRAHRHICCGRQVTFVDGSHFAALTGNHHPALARVVLTRWTTRHGLRAAWDGLRTAVYGLRSDDLLHRSGRHDGSHGRRYCRCSERYGSAHHCGGNGFGSTRRTAMEPITETGTATSVGSRQNDQSQQNQHLPHLLISTAGALSEDVCGRLGGINRHTTLVAVAPIASFGMM